MEIEEQQTTSVSKIVIGLTNSLMKTKEASTKKLKRKTKCRAIEHPNIQRYTLGEIDEM